MVATDSQIKNKLKTALIIAIFISVEKSKQAINFKNL